MNGTFAMWNPDDDKDLKFKQDESRLLLLKRQRESVELAARKELIQKLKASRRFERAQYANRADARGTSAGEVVQNRLRDDIAVRFIPRPAETAKTGNLLRQAGTSLTSFRTELIAALGKRS